MNLRFRLRFLRRLGALAGSDARRRDAGPYVLPSSRLRRSSPVYDEGGGEEERLTSSWFVRSDD